MLLTMKRNGEELGITMKWHGQICSQIYWNIYIQVIGGKRSDMELVDFEIFFYHSFLNFCLVEEGLKILV